MVRPMSDTSAFIQLDDLTETKLDRVRAVAFLTVRTSPGNHQTWIAVPKFESDQDRKDFTRRVKKQVTADSSATGSVRLAGTSNFKTKYIGNYPQVSIIDVAPGRMTTPEALESLGLVAPQDLAPTVVRFNPPAITAAWELSAAGRTISAVFLLRRPLAVEMGQVAAMQTLLGA
jgi:hypothetical protein